jgi:PadR family transcriptional regulator, regulatory protein PadR
MGRRLSPQASGVLRALADDPQQWRYGYELGQQVGLRAGSLYPILMRLSERELLEDSWESDPPAGRPPRHLYRLTAAGQLVAAELPPVAAGPNAGDSARAARARRHDPLRAT